MLPGPAGMIASGVAAAAFAAAGDHKAAKLACVGIALAAVGAGATVAAYKVVKTVQSVKNLRTVAALGIIKKATVHGNSLSSARATWGYKLYSNSGQFLKNGITSKIMPETRYTKAFMANKRMVKIKFPNRRAAYNWEAAQNRIRRGPLNKNWH